MLDNTFGKRLKDIRTSKQPWISQEELGNKVGRTKMAISQFETGKNAPPEGILLEQLITALDATDDEAQELRFLSACSRKSIPGDIESYFYGCISIYDALAAAREAGLDGAAWDEIAKEIRSRNDQ